MDKAGFVSLVRESLERPSYGGQSRLKENAHTIHPIAGSPKAGRKYRFHGVLKMAIRKDHRHSPCESKRYKHDIFPVGAHTPRAVILPAIYLSIMVDHLSNWGIPAHAVISNVP